MQSVTRPNRAMNAGISLLRTVGFFLGLISSPSISHSSPSSDQVDEQLAFRAALSVPDICAALSLAFKPNKGPAASGRRSNMTTGARGRLRTDPRCSPSAASLSLAAGRGSAVCIHAMGIPLATDRCERPRLWTVNRGRLPPRVYYHPKAHFASKFSLPETLDEALCRLPEALRQDFRQPLRHASSYRASRIALPVPSRVPGCALGRVPSRVPRLAACTLPLALPESEKDMIMAVSRAQSALPEQRI